ncbi:VOC family protein [Candidatus Uabimicrobium sp. HlEnr_7]|uniref:VOC family protein n=1 Tax=Candidatus Uabimicrobium helgolandensis TaxID=3095367 RepID=UPI0035574494
MNNFHLGDVVQISFGNTNDIDGDINFFQKLGFKLLGRDTKPYPWANLFDGAIRVVFNQDKLDYCGLTYFAEDMSKRGETLQQLKIEFLDIDFNIGDFYQKAIAGPSKEMLSIIETKINDETMPKTNINQEVAMGHMGEFALPVKNLDESIAFWEKLGYKVQGKYTSPYNWAILKDRNFMVVGLHETSEFDQPAITYFDKEMSTKIKNLEALGVKTKSFGGEENKIAISPSGYRVNLFTGDLKGK